MDQLENLLKSTKNDWFNELSSEEQIEIKTGEKQADNKELFSNETVMNKFAKWHL